MKTFCLRRLHHFILAVALCLWAPYGHAGVLQLNAAPDETAPQAPPLQQSSPSPVQLQAKTQGLSRTLLMRQLQPPRYLQYEAKTQDLKKSLNQAMAYLDGLKDRPMSLQQISAISATVWLDWTEADEALTPAEKQFQSYATMKTAVTELRSLSEYWLTAEQMRRYLRGTQREADQDQAVITQKREKIRTALEQLNQFELLKHHMNAELPY